MLEGLGPTSAAREMPEAGVIEQGSREEDIVEKGVQLYRLLAGSRGTFENHWQEIADRVWPAYHNSFSSLNRFKNQGRKVNELVYDSTAAVALNRFGAILDSLLTPSNSMWHLLRPLDPRMMKDRQAALWYEKVNELLFRYRYSPYANFASQNQQNYKSLGAFGSGCVFVDQLDHDPGLRYRNVHLGEIYFVENHQGMVDEAVRAFPLTARQAIQKWGEKVPDGIKSAMDTNPERETMFLHCVWPNENRDAKRLDYKGMRWSQYYISMEGNKLLSQGGYNTFPYAISRYEQAPSEVYGRSPAMDVLPAIKTLNEQKKTYIKQGHRVVDPVLLAADDGMLDGFSLRPGAVNYGGVNASGQPMVHVLPSGNIAAGKELMEEERNAIKDAFLVSLFQILVETPTMTATEVLERTREKGILLAPTLGRQQSEYLGPMIEREVDLLVRQGLLPPPPPQVLRNGAAYHVQYDSPLSRAQKADEAAGLMRTVETAMNVAVQTQNPEPLDFFDWDTIIPEIAAIQGVPIRWLKSLDQVRQIRQGRDAEKQQAAMMQAAPGAAAMLTATAKAKAAGTV